MLTYMRQLVTGSAGVEWGSAGVEWWSAGVEWGVGGCGVGGRRVWSGKPYRGARSTTSAT